MCPHLIEITDSPVYRGRINAFVNKHNNSQVLCLFVCIGRLCVCVLVDHERSRVLSVQHKCLCLLVINKHVYVCANV